MTRAAGPTLRQRFAGVGSRRPALDVALALGGARAAGSRLRPWLAYHGGLVEDVDEVLRHVFSMNGWREKWERVATRRAAFASRAASEGRDATAFRHGVAAAVAYQSAPYLSPRDEDARRLLASAARAYADALAHAPWRVDRVDVPWRGHALPGWLHAPRGDARDDADDARPPVVVVANAIGHNKETWTGITRALVDRGVAVLAFDAPGTGESAALASPLTAEHVLSPVRDHLEALDPVDASRAGLIGISQGGAEVARAAAMDARWRAVAAVTPPFDPARYARHLPRFLLDALALRTKLPAREVVARAGELSLAPIAPRITAPLLVVESAADYLLPPGEGARLVDAAGSKEKTLVLATERGAHAGIHDFHRVMDEAADFLARVLHAA